MNEKGLEDWIGKLGVSPETIYVVGVIGEFIAKWYAEIQKWEEEKMEAYMERFDGLEKKMDRIGGHVEVVSKVVSELKEANSSVETIVIREISQKDARKEIWDLVRKTKGKIYPSEISKKVGIDYDLTMKIILELIDKEKIEVAGAE